VHCSSLPSKYSISMKYIFQEIWAGKRSLETRANPHTKFPFPSSRGISRRGDRSSVSRVRILSTAYERLARKWNDDVSRKDDPLRSISLSLVLHRSCIVSVDRSLRRVWRVIPIASRKSRLRRDYMYERKWEERIVGGVGWHRV